MAYYRLYSLDLRKKHFTDVFHFSADCDASAILEVRPDSLGVSRELWNKGRKVMDFAPRAAPAAHRETVSRFSNLIESGGRWKWNPLADHCQAVAGDPGPQLADERLATPMGEPDWKAELGSIDRIF